MKIRVSYGLTTFEATKIMFNVNNMSLGEKKVVYKGVVVPVVRYGSTTCDTGMN